MCIAAPGKIIDIQGKKATVSYPGNETREAYIADVKAHVNDYVMVQMGIIISILSRSQAKFAAKAWKK